MTQNHVIDPTYFFDALEEFSFNYQFYVSSPSTVDDYGRRHTSYFNTVIRGSLQSQGSKLLQSKEGNKIEHEYNFFCKSLYRISIGDIIKYKENYYRVNAIRDYDEFGVRKAELSMIQLTSYRDFADYLKYLAGEKII